MALRTCRIFQTTESLANLLCISKTSIGSAKERVGENMTIMSYVFVPLPEALTSP